MGLGKVETGLQSFDGLSRSLGVACEKIQLSFPASQSSAATVDDEAVRLIKMVFLFAPSGVCERVRERE